MHRSVIVETEISAPPEKVYEAWINPQEVIQWWGDDTYYRIAGGDVDARVGGKWNVHGIFHKDQVPFTICGEYLRLEPAKTLLFTWNQSWLEGASTGVEMLIMGLYPSGTLIKVRHMGDPTDELAEGHRAGWLMVLRWMKEYLEAPAPVPS
jgi:uncharacterized protein YndB with AHSA1/START domain